MTPVDFRNALSVLRWSERTVAGLLGVSHNTANRYARGDRKIPADVALWLVAHARLAAAAHAAYPPPRRAHPDLED